jgi:hypothetical protein
MMCRAGFGNGKELVAMPRATDDLSIYLDGHKQLITFQMMKDFGWNGFYGQMTEQTKHELITINKMLYWYSITNMKSIRLFMATCGAESAKGVYTLEIYASPKDYTKEERGAGYIQVTWKNKQLEFLATIGNNYTGNNTAEEVAKYPWDASGWYWGVDKNDVAGKYTPNTYSTTFGDGVGVYLILQYYVRGWPTKSIANSTLQKIRDGMIAWEVKDGKLYANGDEMLSPGDWTRRHVSYIDAQKAFK